MESTIAKEPRDVSYSKSSNQVLEDFSEIMLNQITLQQDYLVFGLFNIPNYQMSV
jgi:hypothetical protein